MEFDIEGFKQRHKNRRAILIEDDPQNLADGSNDLKTLGFSVVTFTNHDDLDALVHEVGKVDVIITDNNIILDRPKHTMATNWVMPFRDIPNNPNANTPVILWTDTEEEAVRIATAVAVGMQGFIHKTWSRSFTNPPVIELLNRVLIRAETKGLDIGHLDVTGNVLAMVTKFIKDDERAKFFNEEEMNILLNCLRGPESAVQGALDFAPVKRQFMSKFGTHQDPKKSWSAGLSINRGQDWSNYFGE